MPASPNPGHVFWLFGLSGTSKSTPATSLIDRWPQRNLVTLAFDGAGLRAGLCRSRGFPDADRTKNLRRTAEAARLGADSGLCVVASLITPLESQRRLDPEIIAAKRIPLVWADAPPGRCRQRDAKGLSAKVRGGEVVQMTGLGSSFEEPAHADLTRPTAPVTPEVSARALLEFALIRLGGLRRVGKIPPRFNLAPYPAFPPSVILSRAKDPAGFAPADGFFARLRMTISGFCKQPRVWCQPSSLHIVGDCLQAILPGADESRPESRASRLLRRGFDP